jgi:RimJ/RimL family protein N-acetyltransferase
MWEILTLDVMATNEIAIRAYKKLVFVQVAIIPKATKFEGKYADDIVMQKEMVQK